MLKTLSPIICILGPTNSGKTDLSLRLFDEISADLISVDSVQIYKHADIGSNKISKDLQSKYPHELIDIIEPNESYSVGEFLKDLKRSIDKSTKSNKVPILVGGSMMYFFSYLVGFDDLPKSDPSVRRKILQDIDTKGKEIAYKKLKAKDPEAAKNIHPNDTQRIVRALEVIEISKKTMSSFFKRKENSISNVFSVVIDKGRGSNFDEDLKNRVEVMLRKGFIDEVEEIIKMYKSNELPLLNSSGYKEVSMYLDNKIKKDVLIEKIFFAHKKLAKHQRTWIKKIPNLKAFQSVDTAKEEIIDYLSY
ncbi:MAG: tRNA (adenosine(37)-N6)-dimethylallyltransferase MiaA [Gammaproteobacteria bacterium]|nr:tRNA (adenosine(37)-N6)-dimethylallyltransferase MiaA [Gammaproteobacteria bacterium]